MTQDEDRKHETMLDAMRATTKRLADENEKFLHNAYAYLRAWHELVSELGVDAAEFDDEPAVQTAAVSTIHALKQSAAASHQRNALLLALGFTQKELRQEPDVVQRDALTIIRGRKKISREQKPRPKRRK